MTVMATRELSGAEPILVHLPTADEVKDRLDQVEKDLRQTQEEDQTVGGVQVKQEEEEEEEEEEETGAIALPFPLKITDNVTLRASVLTAVVRAKRKLLEALEEVGRVHINVSSRHGLWPVTSEAKCAVREGSSVLPVRRRDRDSRGQRW